MIFKAKKIDSLYWKNEEILNKRIFFFNFGSLLTKDFEEHFLN